MSNSIGSNIKKLRKERNFTQEELAELLNVTSQAVSKWENESGMPDISQIVPLASVFGVSTDALFGLGEDEDGEALKIVGEADAITKYGNPESYLAAYERVTEGFNKYPLNMILLNNAMGLGLTLALPENSSWYRPCAAKKIAAETKRQAELIAEYSKDMSEVMGARRALVLLYSSEGSFERAISEARKFPVRTDFTLYSNLAAVFEHMGDHARAAACLCEDIDHSLQALADDAARLGKAYFNDGKYKSAITVYEAILAALDAAFGDNPRPPYHDFDSGDCFILLAEAYLKIGDAENAMKNIEKSVKFYLDLAESCKGAEITRQHLTASPIIQNTQGPCIKKTVIKQKLLEKLSYEGIKQLSGDKRFKKLRGRAREI